MKAKYYIGPMSLNVIDCVIEHSQKQVVGLIPSRRQIDYNGGYVNKWNTSAFSSYVRNYSENVLLCRDHGGPLQGSVEDDGQESFETDSKYLDLIHVDPFKAAVNINDAAERTVSIIEKLNDTNPNLFYEVGTEEAIRRYEPEDLQLFLSYLRINLLEKEFQKIKYAVVQSGTGLDLANAKNTGTFDAKRLEQFVLVCKGFDILSKEHNGDFLTENDQIVKRFDLGLDAINIAPEFGLIETNWYIEASKNEPKIFEDLFEICYNSNKWKKWVNKHNQDKLTKESYVWMCCHYLLSDSTFLEKVKSNFPNADYEIRKAIIKRLDSIYEQTKNYCI